MLVVKKEMMKEKKRFVKVKTKNPLFPPVIVGVSVLDN